MKKYLLIHLVVGSVILVPAFFTGANATGTGTTNTGSTSTGTTGTGTTGTGIICGTGSEIRTELKLAQETFLTELTRLRTERKVAYLVAQTYTSSMRAEKIKDANLKFRTGYRAAQHSMKMTKKTLHKDEWVCKEMMREDDNDKQKQKVELKDEIERLKEEIDNLRKKLGLLHK